MSADKTLQPAADLDFEPQNYVSGDFYCVCRGNEGCGALVVDEQAHRDWHQRMPR